MTREKGDDFGEHVTKEYDTNLAVAKGEEDSAVAWQRV